MMKNPYVRFCENNVVNCGNLVDWAARDVEQALCGPRSEALRALALLQSAERWWYSPRKVDLRKLRGVETPFTAARRRLEAGLK